MGPFSSFQNNILPLPMTSQDGKQIIMMHTLLNISRSKSNKTVKSGQFIEYNLRNIFLEKSYTICGTGTELRTSKKSKLKISWGHQSEHLYGLFLLLIQVRNYQNILKLRC